MSDNLNLSVTDAIVQAVSPTATVSKVGSTTTLTVTDKNGTTTANIEDGVKGDKGDTGLTPDLSIGTVTTLPAGSSATASITGTDEEPVLNLGIPKGDLGKTPVLSVDEVETLDPGEPATASITGTADNPILNLGIPQGSVGATPDLGIGTVSTLAPGSSATASITGTDEEPKLNLGLPQGAKGDTGDTGATGNGISNITETATSGAVHTYTINFTDGTTTTFDVTDGEVTNAQLQEVIDARLNENVLSISQANLSTGYYISESGGKWTKTVNSGSWYTDEPIDVSKYQRIRIRLNALNNGSRKFGFVDGQGFFVGSVFSEYNTESRFELKNGMYEAEFDVTADYFVFSYTTNTTNILIDAHTNQFYSKGEINETTNELIENALSLDISDLEIGKYWGHYGDGVSLLSNSESYAVPEPIDVSDYLGETIKISTRNLSSGARLTGFLDLAKKTTTYYAEATLPFVYDTVQGVYIAELEIKQPYFVFSCNYVMASGIKIEINRRVSYTRKQSNDNNDVIERFVGLSPDKYVAPFAELRKWDSGDREYSALIDVSEHKAVGVDAIAGFQTVIFYGSTVGDQPNNTGWSSVGSSYAYDGTNRYALIGFKKNDNTNFTSAEYEAMKSNVNIWFIDDKLSLVPTAYVSTTGNDTTGNGSSALPFATVNKALSTGATTIFMLAGTYDQSIDLANATSGTIIVKNITKTQKVVFNSPTLKITSEESVSGYSNVYKAPFSGTIGSSIKRIWQENVADIRTLISDEDRHPCQRGQEYRLFDTMIQRCAADNLADALTEIESAGTTYKWYFDSDNSIIYFNRPSSVSSSYPICGDTTSKAFISNATRAYSLKMYGIDVKYMAVDLSNLSNPELYDCKASNMNNSGGFIYDQCLSALFVRCEACGNVFGSNGDGFNGHSQNTGELFAKQTTCELLDCWSHDNYDDGYSDHERSETVVRGGLFENNGKGGIVPSYGSHCCCYGVVSRYNYNGFYYTGDVEVAEGGKYGQMACYDCVAKGNRSVGNVGSGFRVNGTKNSMYLVNCRSIENNIGYVPEGSNNLATLIECTAKDNTYGTKGGSGTFTVLNGILVTN